ncbi:MAG: tRNA lysidine(34) synthetase TilS [Clostridia bacterium]|nr:tRNA lysidine(34) synthetase TilS [Clostridia bacterium]
MKNNFLEIIQKHIEKYDLLKKDEPVLVAFSGGFDSVCLALCLKELGYTFGLAHLNHGLRENAEQDASFCRSFAQKLNVPFYYKEVNVAKMASEQKITVETAGRNARYDFFADIKGYDKIATGHHKNDLAETVIQHLIRGTGLKGLTGIAPKRDNIVRPLLCVTRSEIEAFVSSYGITPQTDETNQSTDYNRNRIRLEVMPLLERENENVTENIARTAFLAAQDEEFLEQSASCYVQENKIDIDLLKTLHPALACRALRLAYANAAGTQKDFEQRHVSYILENLKSHGEIMHLCFDVICKAEYGMLIFEKKKEYVPFCYEITPDCTVKIPEIERTFLVFVSDKPQGDHYFDYSELKNKPLYIRSPREGDKFYPFGTTGGKGINKLLIDLKIPATERKKLPLLTTDSEILNIIGIKRSRFYPSTAQTIKFLNILEEPNK